MTQSAELLAWAAERELQHSDRGNTLRWIAWGPHQHGEEEITDRIEHRWFVNVSGWTKHGNPAVLCCQPTVLGVEDIEDLRRTAHLLGLRYFITHGWHGPNSLLIELFLDTGRKRGAGGRLLDLEDMPNGFDWLRGA